MVDFSPENEHKNAGFEPVIGVDEVGRGSLAGPVVAGAVVLRNSGVDWLSLGIDDSKRLTATKRTELSLVICQHAYWAVGEVSAEVINSLGIVRATQLAMKQAVEKLILVAGGGRPFVLVDGLPVPVFREMGLESRAIVRGDQISISIAAASIVAKVCRDELMVNLAEKQEFANYEWQTNKGYGTKIHLQAIEKFGPTAMHRSDFLRSPETVD